MTKRTSDQHLRPAPRTRRRHARRSHREPYADNGSSVFYGAYVYFEKLRVKEGKPKGKKREGMEKIHGDKGGMNLKIRLDNIKVLGESRVDMDKYARVEITAPDGRKY